MSTEKTKILSLVDEEGNKLPKNMSAQFRNVQSGIEHLKDSADNIVQELKGVNHKLGANTTDLGLITKKVNEIEKRQVQHMNITKKSLKQIENLNTAILRLLLKVETRVSGLENDNDQSF